MDARSLNAELQAEEIEVLESIYEHDFALHATYDDAQGVRCFTIALPGQHALQLLVHVPLGYPTTDAPVAEVYDSRGLTNAQRDEIVQSLDAVFTRAQGQVCLYEWIENVRERFSFRGTDTDALAPSSYPIDLDVPLVDASAPLVAFTSDPQTLRPRVRTAQLVRDPLREAHVAPRIIHGTPITDRKSTFQGHACRVESVDDVRSFLALLLDDRKVERALHNMLAYRIVVVTSDSSSSQYVVKDNDEDGEDAAGAKLSHLLELLKVDNVAVVVTRWYGGVLLGPDRFKHICTAARETLEVGGFVDVTVSQKKSKSKKH